MHTHSHLRAYSCTGRICKLHAKRPQARIRTQVLAPRQLCSPTPFILIQMFLAAYNLIINVCYPAGVLNNYLDALNCKLGKVVASAIMSTIKHAAAIITLEPVCVRNYSNSALLKENAEKVNYVCIYRVQCCFLLFCPCAAL